MAPASLNSDQVVGIIGEDRLGLHPRVALGPGQVRARCEERGEELAQLQRGRALFLQRSSALFLSQLLNVAAVFRVVKALQLLQLLQLFPLLVAAGQRCPARHAQGLQHDQVVIVF